MFIQQTQPTASTALVRVAAGVGGAMIALLVTLAIVRPDMMDVMHMVHRMIPLWCPC